MNLFKWLRLQAQGSNVHFAGTNLVAFSSQVHTVTRVAGGMALLSQTSLTTARRCQQPKFMCVDFVNTQKLSHTHETQVRKAKPNQLLTQISRR